VQRIKTDSYKELLLEGVSRQYLLIPSH
jgi:hypothetical protein